MCIEVINNFASADQSVASVFFQQYFLSIMQDIFYVLTDTDHKSGFKLQSMLLDGRLNRMGAVVKNLQDSFEEAGTRLLAYSGHMSKKRALSARVLIRTSLFFYKHRCDHG